MASPPLVSVIVATRNRADLLPVALRSIRDQDMGELEVLVVDDGSNAATLATYDSIWRDEALDERFQLLGGQAPDLPGSGPAAARNRGIAAARGRWIAFCDDDDHWCVNDHLSTAMKALEAADADLFIANMRGEANGRVTIPDWFPGCHSLTRGRCVLDAPAVHEVALRDLMKALRHHYAHPNGMVVSRDLLNAVGGFWDRLRHAEDINLVLRLADAATGILYRADPVVGFNVSHIEKNYTSVSRMEHRLILALAAEHAEVCSTQRSIHRSARAISAWSYRNVSEELAALGRIGDALGYALRSWTTRPTPGTTILPIRLLSQWLLQRNGRG